VNDIDDRLGIVVAERDQAREECGHEKAMRKYMSEELSGWIKRYTAAASALEAHRRRTTKAEVALTHIAKHESGEWPGPCCLGRTPGQIARSALASHQGESE